MLSMHWRGYTARGEEFSALEGCEVYRVSDGSKVTVPDAWGNGKALVAFGRSFG